MLARGLPGRHCVGCGVWKSFVCSVILHRNVTFCSVRLFYCDMSRSRSLSLSCKYLQFSQKRSLVDNSGYDICEDFAVDQLRRRCTPWGYLVVVLHSHNECILWPVCTGYDISGDKVGFMLLNSQGTFNITWYLNSTPNWRSVASVLQNYPSYVDAKPYSTIKPGPNQAPICLPCNSLLTVEHRLIISIDFDIIRRNFYRASNLKDLFHSIYPKCIISFIHAIGLTNKLKLPHAWYSHCLHA